MDNVQYFANHCILRIEMLMRFMFLMNVFSQNFVKFTFSLFGFYC